MSNLNPKDKAEELVEKMLESLYDNGSFSFKKILYPKAKQCALIAQQNILQKLKELNIEDSFEEQVKTEIENL